MGAIGGDSVPGYVAVYVEELVDQPSGAGRVQYTATDTIAAQQRGEVRFGGEGDNTRLKKNLFKAYFNATFRAK